MTDTYPTVTCIMAAFNYEGYVEAALDSVLEQQYPADALDVVVVDDGSTDGTVEVIRSVAARAAGRVTLLQQENAGEARANDNALAHARGELLAKCDADDLWLPGKVAAQASIFASRPEVSLVYGDMRVIDGTGTVLEPSFFTKESIAPRRGRLLEELAAWNFAPNSTLMFRARDVKPIPARMPFADYWLAAVAAQAGEVEVVTTPVADYRMHGSNRGYGSSGDAYVRKLARELLGRRLVLAEVYRSLRLDALLTILNELVAKAIWTASLGSLTLPEVVDVQEDERRSAADARERARIESDAEERIRLLALAVILDPMSDDARAELVNAVQNPPQPVQAEATAATRISVEPSARPCVSVVVPAFNLARYLPAALQTALDQSDPGGPVEVIVVDDGSVDDTPAVLETFAGRVRSVRQENAGLLAAVNTGVGLARGEFIALLDADDEWPRDRLQRHVSALESDPALGLVHGDMEIIGADGSVVHPSFFAREQVQAGTGRILGSLLGGNSVSGGASTFRASLLPALYPFVAEAAYPDWWIAACVSCVASIGIAPGIANRYRQHGENMSLGSTAADQPKIQGWELPWRRWMYSHLVNDETIEAGHLHAALASLQFGLRAAAYTSPAGARGLLAPDRAAAAALLATLPAAGPGAPRSRALLAALAADPFDAATAIDLEMALQRESQLGQAAPPPPLIELDSRPEVALAWLDEVLSDHTLLTAFRTEADRDSTSLVILAPPHAQLEPLITLVSADAELSGPDFDIRVITAPATTPARRLLAARATTVLTRRSPPMGYESVPPLEIGGAAVGQAHAVRAD
jgi:glycosyltransferase involved in cell wall biosynthesis